MKKFFVLLICVTLLFLTGCELKNPFAAKEKEERTLTCTKEMSASGIPMSQIATIKFIDNKIDNLSTTILVKLPDAYKSQIDTFYNALEEQYDKAYKIKDHIKITTTKTSDSEIKVDIFFDYKNMTDEEKKQSEFEGSEDYDINKSTLEKDGYTCK